jgi:hypothetical protein
MAPAGMTVGPTPNSENSVILAGNDVVHLITNDGGGLRIEVEIFDN